MNIFIFGASGATGNELVNQALALGHNVTAFVHNPSKLKIRHDNLKVVQGDVINYQLVEGTVKGQNAIISALGATSHAFQFICVSVCPCILFNHYNR